MYDLAAKWEPPISLDSKDAVDIFDIIMNPGNRSVPKGLVWETYRGTANDAFCAAERTPVRLPADIRRR